MQAQRVEQGCPTEADLQNLVSNVRAVCDSHRPHSIAISLSPSNLSLYMTSVVRGVAYRRSSPSPISSPFITRLAPLIFSLFSLSHTLSVSSV